jgi:hypothetical protein
MMIGMPGVDVSMAFNRNNGWDANDANSLRIAPCGGITPCTTSRDLFLERHTEGCPTHSESNDRSSSEERYARTVGSGQFFA